MFSPTPLFVLIFEPQLHLSFVTAIGMDGDTDLTFLPGGAARMVEYGCGVSDYDGTYSINDEGGVTMKFPTFGHTWPLMTLRKDSVSLLLLPKSSPDGFVMGNRGGVTFLSGQGSYWPFRPPGEAEKAVSKSDR